MVPARGSELTLIFVAGFLSAKPGVDGFEPSCPPTAVFPLTEEEIPDTFEFLNKSDDVFQIENRTRLENDVQFGCLCDSKLCVPLCCPEGYASTENGCEQDNLTFLITDLNHEKSSREHHVFTYDSCPSSLMDEYVLDDDFKLLPNGSIYFEARSEMVHLGGYCLHRELHTRKYSAARCNTSNWTNSSICFVVSTSVCTIFTLAALIVYTVAPGLKNLQGSMCRCFSISYLAGTLMLAAAVNLSFSNDLSSIPLGLFVTVAYLGFAYWCIACFLWMNVMSIDIWRNVRKFQLRPGNNVTKHQKSEFVRYSIYVWGSSALFILPPTLCSMSQSLSPIRELILTCWASLTFLSIVIINICLYIATAITIRQQRKEATYVIIGTNNDRQKNEEWFNLYVKLFVAIVGPVILFALGFCWENDMFQFILFVIQGLQGVFIFLILVMKDGVIRSFRKRFNEILRKVFHRPRDTTFTISV